MKIALDYDNTYTLHPEFWQVFIGMATGAGHEIRVVTVRDERFDRTAPLIELEDILPVIYTRGVAKRWYLSHFGDGFVPDVWIDDSPDSIISNSSFSPDALAEWRATRDH